MVLGIFLLESPKKVIGVDIKCDLDSKSEDRGGASSYQPKFDRFWRGVSLGMFGHR